MLQIRFCCKLPMLLTKIYSLVVSVAMFFIFNGVLRILKRKLSKRPRLIYLERTIQALTFMIGNQKDYHVG